MKKKVFIATSVFLTLSAFLVFTSLVQAERLESDSYLIQFGNFNVTSGEKSSASYSVTDTVGQTGSGPYGQYGSSDYFIGSGFQYIYQIDTFSFAISKVLVDFGDLTVNTHTTDSHTLTITTRGAGGYSVYAYEQNPLRHENTVDEIPDTTCNAGTCTHILAGVWNDQTVPGFGYNMSGNDIPATFTNSSYYKNFANEEAAEEMQIVMSSASIANQRQATVTYKVGVDANQEAGKYETAVVYVAVPGY